MTIRLDNAGELSSQAFIDYCISIGINVQYSIAHVHTQNALQKNLHLEMDISVSNPSRNGIPDGLETEFSVLKTLVSDFYHL